MKQGQRRIASLEVGRGVAASMVVLHHAGSLLAQPRYYGEHLFGGFLAYLYVGVDFFFVLSGFIIAWVHFADLGDRGALKSYAAKRFLRIFPPYWAILLPLIALYFVFPGSGLDSQRDPMNIVVSVLLLPSPVPPVLGVAWTLTYEIFFYAIFAGMIAVGRRGLWFMPAWALAILASSPFDLFSHSYYLAFVLSPYNLEFIMGVGVAVLLRHRSLPMPGAAAALGLISFVALLVLPTPIFESVLLQRLGFGLSAALLVAGVVEREWHRPLKLPSAFVLFGAASYVLYLIHPVVLSFATIGIVRVLGTALPLWSMLVLISLLALAAGILFHLLLEKRVTQAARTLLQRAGMVAARPGPAEECPTDRAPRPSTASSRGR